MNLVTRLASLLVTVVVSYGIAIFLFSVADQVSAMPSGPLWDDSLRVSVRFILIIIGLVALVVPAFRSESPASQRSQAIFAACFFAGYVFLKITRLLDPDVPLHVVVSYVQPVWQSITQGGRN